MCATRSKSRATDSSNTKSTLVDNGKQHKTAPQKATKATATSRKRKQVEQEVPDAIRILQKVKQAAPVTPKKRKVRDEPVSQDPPPTPKRPKRAGKSAQKNDQPDRDNTLPPIIPKLLASTGAGRKRKHAEESEQPQASTSKTLAQEVESHTQPQASPYKRAKLTATRMNNGISEDDMTPPLFPPPSGAPSFVPTSILEPEHSSQAGPSRLPKENSFTFGRSRSDKGKNKLIYDTLDAPCFGNLPCEIFCEIVTYLHPIDLVYLSRVNKTIREVLNPYGFNKIIWQYASRQIDDLPDCPDDLNEAQYAALLFENRCCICNSKGNSIIDFSYRARYCEKCYSEVMAPALNVFRQRRLKARSLFLISFVPRSIYGKPNNPLATSRPDIRLFNINALTQASEDWYALRDNPAAQKAWEKECAAECGKIEDSADELDSWQRRTDMYRMEMEKKISKQRCSDIIRRLQKVGWTLEEIERITDKPKLHALLHKPKELNDRRIWGPIKYKIETYLCSLRLERRYKEFWLYWDKAVQQKTVPLERLLVPSQQEARSIPTVIDLLSENLAGIPVTVERLTDAFDEIRWDCQKHKINCIRSLLSVIEDGRGPDSNETTTTADLSDDAVLMKEPELYNTLYFFRCLDSRCLHYPPMALDDMYVHSRVNHQTKSWTSSSIVKYDPEAEKVAKKVLEVLGLDTNLDHEIFYDDMDEFNGRLICKCGDPEVKDKKLCYGDLMKHIFLEHYKYNQATKAKEVMSSRCPGAKFPHELINDHDMSKLGELIIVLPQTKKKQLPRRDPIIGVDASDLCPPIKPRKYTCHCLPCKYYNNYKTELGPDQEDIVYHLRAKHGLEYDDKHITQHYGPWKCRVSPDGVLEINR